MSDPIVTVAIPTRNRAAWLEEALESVFAQSFQDFEIVVGDDASSDRTTEVLLKRSEPRLRVLRHDSPRGVAANRNAIFAAAKGRYVAWLDSDDRYLPDLLAARIERLESSPGVVLAHGGFDVIDAGGRKLPDWPAAFAEETVERGPDAFRELVTGNYIAAPTVVVRREAQARVGPYRESLVTGEDWELWMRLALTGDFAYSPAKLVQYRWHTESLSRRAEATGSRFRRELAALQGVFSGPARNLPEAAELEERADAALAARALLAATECRTRGARWAAVARLFDAARAWPDIKQAPLFLPLFFALFSSNDYPWHRRSCRTIGELADLLGEGRVAERLRRQVAPSPQWSAALQEMAAAVRRATPENARLAVVDKWDPTLLHLAGRRGWHFPDRRLLPDGYPRDSSTAVRHLKDLARRGAQYFVVPVSSFWWFDAYPGLSEHLSRRAEPVWSDARCRIYRLDAAGARGPGSTPRRRRQLPEARTASAVGGTRR